MLGGKIYLKSVDKIWIIFRDYLIGFRDKLLPKRSLTLRLFLPWMTSKMKKGIKKINMAWRIFNKCPSHKNKEKYQKF